tara:strand:+ start:5198 stop:5581 length:384 start_codon:yes stop_codon:yes gene_type:complete
VHTPYALLFDFRRRVGFHRKSLINKKKEFIMNKPENLLEVFLAKAKSGRWYFTARTFNQVAVKGKRTKTNYANCLAPVGSNPIDLDPGAITTCILPIELNDKDRDWMIDEFGAVADIDTTSGQLYLR